VLTVRVVKLGGNELDRPDWLATCASAIKSAGPVVVVHGGGKAVDALSRRLGLPIEKRVVAALRRAGVDAVGLSGVDGGLLTARQLAGGFGQVGAITDVRASLLHSLLLAGLTPVVAPVAPDDQGTPLNVNADDAAAAVAAALRAEELLFVSDVAGVAVGGVPQPSLAAGEIETLIDRGVATNGMAAKLRAAARALQTGARAVRIGDLEVLTSRTAGTRIFTAAPQPA